MKVTLCDTLFSKLQLNVLYYCNQEQNYCKKSEIPLNVCLLYHDQSDHIHFWLKFCFVLNSIRLVCYVLCDGFSIILEIFCPSVRKRNALITMFQICFINRGVGKCAFDNALFLHLCPRWNLMIIIMMMMISETTAIITD